jgi:transcription antitermination factor NusG
MSDPMFDETTASAPGCQSGKASLDSVDRFDPDSSWYAVWTRSKQEKVVAAILSSRGIRNYLPLKSELRQWSDRKQLVEAPLFSGYLFVHITLFNNLKLQVLRVPGVVSLVGNQSGPAPIPGHQIEDIRTVLTAGAQCSVHPVLQEGDRVRVIKGALAGVEGTLLHTNSTSRLLLSIEMIRQSISVSVSREDIELVSANTVLTMYFGQSAASPNDQSRYF